MNQKSTIEWYRRKRKEAEKNAKRRNKYMEKFWKNFNELTRKKSIDCAFCCGRKSIPGEDLCEECKDNYEKYKEKGDLDGSKHVCK